MDQNELPLEPRHRVVPSGVSKMITEPMVALAQTVHLYCTTLTLSPNGPKWDSKWPMSPRSFVGCIQNNFTASGMFGTNRAPRHLRVPLGVSKMIFDPMVRLVQTMHLSPNWPWASSHRSSIRCVQNNMWVYGMVGANHAPILHWHKYYLQIDRNEIPHDPRHLGVPSGASKTNSEPVVRLAQTVHQPCIKISILSKRTEVRIH
jgi:hypothetical protein